MARWWCALILTAPISGMARSGSSSLLQRVCQRIRNADIIDNQGVYEIQIAPSNSNIMYMMFDGYVFKTHQRRNDLD